MLHSPINMTGREFFLRVKVTVYKVNVVTIRDNLKASQSKNVRKFTYA